MYLSGPRGGYGDANLVEYMCLGVEALGLAGLAEVKIVAVRASVPRPPDGKHAARVALAATVGVRISPRGILGDAKQQLDDVLAVAVALRRLVHVPVLVVVLVHDGLAVAQRPHDDVTVFSLVIGVFGKRRTSRGGRLVVLSRRPAAAVDGIAAVETRARGGEVGRLPLGGTMAIQEVGGRHGC